MGLLHGAGNGAVTRGRYAGLTFPYLTRYPDTCSVAYGTWYLTPDFWHLALEPWHLEPDTWDLAPGTCAPGTWNLELTHLTHAFRTCQFYCYTRLETSKAVWDNTPSKVTPFSCGDFVRCFGWAKRSSFLICGSVFRCYYFSKTNSQIAANVCSKH